MPEWLQGLVVVVSVGLVAIALFALVTLKRLVDKVSSDLSQLTQTVRESATRIDRVSDEAGKLMTDVRAVVSPVQQVVQRLVGLSSSLFDEVEPPLRTATALARGVRVGTGYFMQRMMNRFTHRLTNDHGGDNNER